MFTSLLTLSALAVTPLGPSVRLRSGALMPTVALGSSGGCGPDSFDTPGNVPCQEYNATLSWFQQNGRSVHTALSYCNQYGVGRAFHDSGLRRKDVFLMSMVPKFLMGYNETIASVRASLQQMGLERLDLVMIHHRAADINDWPREVCPMAAFPDQPTTTSPTGVKKAVWDPPACAKTDPTWLRCQDETWQALLDLKKEGIVTSAGVSNWPLSSLRRMEALGQELPEVNQVEVHVGWHEDDLIDYCASRSIVVQAASPLARFAPAIVGHPSVVAASKAHNRTAAQVMLRWLIERGVAPLPSAHSVAYQRENLAIFDFSLQRDEVLALNNVVAGCRGAAADGLAKCWADPATLMCRFNNGSTFHCP
eukprot:Hpha_TRINITY_DN19871_c0_g1::TRINITY_DN19871_c0_g1_i1::g.132159::m.132159